MHGAVMGMSFITNTIFFYHNEHHFNNIQKYLIQCGHKIGVHEIKGNALHYTYFYSYRKLYHGRLHKYQCPKNF